MRFSGVFLKKRDPRIKRRQKNKSLKMTLSLSCLVIFETNCQQEKMPKKGGRPGTLTNKRGERAKRGKGILAAEKGLGGFGVWG